jgi:hypothetical protein
LGRQDNLIKQKEKPYMIKTIVMSIAALCVIPMMAQATPTVESVPEPSTIFAGAALLVPFGISAVRAMRKNRRK